MISKPIQMLEKAIRMNHPLLTNFVCYVFTLEEAFRISKAVQQNEFITGCIMHIQPNAYDYNKMQICNKMMLFKAQKNAYFNDSDNTHIIQSSLV